MALLADERAQSIQVGAVLLFAILILAFSTYQAVIVPDQNRQVEFDHNQEVQSQLGELRDRFMATQDGGAPRSTTVDLGTSYPSRAIALNPSAPSGSLRTVGTTDSLFNLTIDNAVAAGETRDYWDGDPRHYDTGGITYEPAYHNYDDAPTTGYEHSVLYNDFDADSLVLANQSFIEGTEISLVTINGSLERTSSTATTVDTRPLSGSERTIQIDDDSDGPITLNFTSQLSADRWNTTLSDQEYVENVTGFPSAAGEEFNAIRVTLAPGPTYELEMAKAAVGTGATDEPPSYLVDVEGDGGSVARGNSQELTLEMRDDFNNPVQGVTVNGSVASAGSLDGDGEATTNEEGQVTFVYETTSETATGTHQVNFTTNASATLSARPFDDDRQKNVSMSVTVTDGAGGGGGVYDLDWTNPDLEAANDGASLTNCDEESCTWDAGASSDDQLDLNATLSPAFENIDIEFALSNGTVGAVSPDIAGTGSDGAAMTTLTAQENGTVDILASANEDSNILTVEVTNVTGVDGGDTQPPTVNYARAGAVNNDGDQNDIEYVDFNAQVSDNVEIDRVEFRVFDKNGDQVGESIVTQSPYSEFVFVDPDQQMQGGGNSIDVEIVVYDTSGNSRTCTGQINDVGGSVDTGGGLTCTQTSP